MAARRMIFANSKALGSVSYLRQRLDYVEQQYANLITNQDNLLTEFENLQIKYQATVEELDRVKAELVLVKQGVEI